MATLSASSHATPLSLSTPVQVDVPETQVAAPRVAALIVTWNRKSAVDVVLRALARQMWRDGNAGIDVAAVEYMDARSLRYVPDAAFARAGASRPEGSHSPCRRRPRTRGP